MQLSDKAINTLLFIAMAACLIGATADVLLLYSPNGGYEDQTYNFLRTISPSRLLWGHFLGVLFIPLELLGLFHIYRGLQPAGTKWVFPLLIITIFTIFPGVAYHATCAFTATLLQMQAQGGEEVQTLVVQQLSFLKSLFEPLGGFLAIGMIVLSLLFGHIVFWKETYFKRWVAFAMPLTFYIIFGLFYLLWPSIGNVLIPAGFNLAFFGMFVCSWLGRIE